jgi:predicted RNase H-like HicB family nuclease
LHSRCHSLALNAAVRCKHKDESPGRSHVKVIGHEADEGGFWGEVPAIPGCASQGETLDELLADLKEAIEGCRSVDVAEPQPGGKERVLEIAL